MNYRAEVSASADLFELHRAYPQRYPFLLQSVADHPVAGRYDILFADPERWLRCPADGDIFSLISSESGLAAQRQASDVPFCGGWFLLLGYEAVRWAEPQLKLPPSPYSLPDGLAVRCSAAIVHDREQKRCILLAEHSAAQLESLQRDFATLKKSSQSVEKEIVSSVIEEPEARFLEGVRRILDYLKAGDVFQINLSRAWRAALRPEVTYQDIYQALRRSNPAPFAGVARIGDSAVISSSPERLIQIEAGMVQTRPIAGTRPRGATDAEDRKLRQRLIESFKERAEHVMLIDLERNDLGRVCEPGSVEVSELMAIESYAHVHHIVSNVRGRLREGVRAGEAIRAVFPGGTITGCPKVRAMQIIAELEGVGRGPYTGAMGYLSSCGRLDLNILIRSLVVENGQVSFRAGAGIVADSVAEAELAETRAKARGLLLALGAAA